ncbi:Rossmann-fold NAD(P)-binding domain-containing protein [Mucilaginibacter ginkgonis]|uniref:Lactate dehydrogenase n=1 Tax=Mucilaginibacter ginkgonis TaxID=2682091 RepID=A0A6I4HUZ5_9SPHI|nr:lactate dehydrogenase [Mucilaginibacter ginkgonis]QQL50253.1 lactate dehydrogenase [Mucilaginibacter ginkgonis]
MKTVAYSIKPFEKEFLALANQKKHDITLISNPLGLDTLDYAEGKEAVIVFTTDIVSGPVIEILSGMGVRYIATRSDMTGHIDKEAAARYGIKLANTPGHDPDALQAIANQTIKNLDRWQLNKCVGNACICAKDCRATHLQTQKDQVNER